MIRQNLLPLLRRKKTWITLAAAILLLIVSAAWMDKAVADNQAEMDRAYQEMDVHFSLSPGRRNLSANFSVTRYSLRTIVLKGYFEGFGSAEVWCRNVYWAFDPEAAGIRALEGELKEGGVWLPRSIAESEQLGVGDVYTVQPDPNHSYGFFVTALIEGEKIYMPADSFNRLCEYFDVNRFSLSSLRFDLKKQYNKKTTVIEKELQSLLNTPRPADKNRDVSVNYNAAEVDGMLKPMEKSIESAEFFGKLFRTVLPAVAYAIEFIALIGLRNEIGARKLLGDKPARVFVGIWLPVLALSLPGYLCSSAVLLLTPLRKCAPWRMMLLHLAGTAALIAVVTAVLCALRPLTLLKEKQDE